MRRVQIANLPIFLGLRQDDVKAVVSNFILTQYLTDEGNNEPVIECELNSRARTAVVELSSVEEATRFSKVNFISILGVRCRITRVGETMYGETTNAGRHMARANVSQHPLFPNNPPLGRGSRPGRLLPGHRVPEGEGRAQPQPQLRRPLPHR